MKTYYLILVTLSLLSITSCNQEKDTAPLVLDHKFINREMNEVVNMPYLLKYFFNKYDAVYLENTQGLHVWDIKNVLPLNDSLVVMLANNRLFCYNYLSGKEYKEFDSKECDYISVDTGKDNSIYALAGNGGQYLARKIDTLGKIALNIPLDKEFAYDNIILLDSTKALISAVTYPYPVTFVVDFASRQIFQLDIPQKRNEKYEKAFVDSLKRTFEIKSLFCFSRSKNGDVIGKYLFDNTFYKYTANGKQAFIDVKSDKHIEYKDDVYKSENRGKFHIPTGIFKIMDSTYLFQWQKWTGVYGSKPFNYRIFTLLDSNLEGITHTPPFDPIYSFGWASQYYEVYDISSMHNSFLHSRDRMAFTVKRNNLNYKSSIKNKVFLPAHLQHEEQYDSFYQIFFLSSSRRYLICYDNFSVDNSFSR